MRFSFFHSQLSPEKIGDGKLQKGVILCIVCSPIAYCTTTIIASVDQCMWQFVYVCCRTVNVVVKENFIHKCVIAVLHRALLARLLYYTQLHQQPREKQKNFIVKWFCGLSLSTNVISFSVALTHCIDMQHGTHFRTRLGSDWRPNLTEKAIYKKN